MKKQVCEISMIQMQMLLERYRQQAADPRRTSYGKQVAEETVAALIELASFRKNTAIPVRGTVR